MILWKKIYKNPFLFSKNLKICEIPQKSQFFPIPLKRKGLIKILLTLFLKAQSRENHNPVYLKISEILYKSVKIETSCTNIDMKFTNKINTDSKVIMHIFAYISIVDDQHILHPMGSSTKKEFLF